jgi:hypothetical protein
MSFNGAPVMAATVVAVDVGKNKAALSITSADRHRLFSPADFAMTEGPPVHWRLDSWFPTLTGVSRLVVSA